MTAAPGTRDVRELLGMQSRAATFIVWFYMLTFAMLAVVSLDGVSAFWPEAVAVLVVTGGAVALLRVVGDPLPLPSTLVLAGIGPVSCALVLSVLPAPVTSPLQTWPIGASTAIYTFMCVRGRTWYAWLGFASMVGVVVAWSIQTGQGAGPGISMSVISLAPVLMSTFFAYTIRPDARAIFELREQTTRRVAAEAADSAVLEERDRQLRRLDELARPLLEQISTGVELTTADRLACQLLEAHLRDTLRAPALTQGTLVAAARAARARGVEVILLDDHGLDRATAKARARFLAGVADELDAARDGAVTVRILPPAREAAATLLATSGNSVRRIEFGSDGLPIQPAPRDKSFT